MFHQRICFPRYARGGGASRQAEARIVRCAGGRRFGATAMACGGGLLCAARLAARSANHVASDLAGAGGRTAGPAGARSCRGAASSRFDSPPDCDRGGRVRSGPPAIRRKPLSTLGSRALAPRGHEHRRLSARTIRRRAVSAARRSCGARHPDRWLRYRRASHRHGAPISRRARVGRRSQSEQPWLRGAQDAANWACKISNTRRPIFCASTRLADHST